MSDLSVTKASALEKLNVGNLIKKNFHFQRYMFVLSGQEVAEEAGNREEQKVRSLKRYSRDFLI